MRKSAITSTLRRVAVSIAGDQGVLPSAETAAMLFWALLAAGQIVLRKVDGWTSLAEPLGQPIDLAV
jgi:hypothetical protein